MWQTQYKNEIIAKVSDCYVAAAIIFFQDKMALMEIAMTTAWTFCGNVPDLNSDSCFIFLKI